MPVWLDVLIRVAGIVVAFLTLPLIVGQTEHKVMAHIFAVAFVIIWWRVAFPRLREDQLQRNRSGTSDFNTRIRKKKRALTLGSA